MELHIRRCPRVFPQFRDMVIKDRHTEDAHGKLASPERMFLLAVHPLSDRNGFSGPGITECFPLSGLAVRIAGCLDHSLAIYRTVGRRSGNLIVVKKSIVVSRRN